MAVMLDTHAWRAPEGAALWRRGRWGGALLVATLVVGCATPPPPSAPPPVVVAPPAAPAPAPTPAPEPPFTGKVSLATNERDYRRDGAQHLYERYGERVFRGKLPPLVQAVAVMRLDIGPRGELRHFEWMRAPDHVPHVKAEIERLVREAAPFPAPMRLGGVHYTDTWLWDKSGTFQLDTLTEGQLDRLPSMAAPKSPPASAAPTARKRAPASAARKATGTATRVAQDSAPTSTLPAR
ncbi:MAG: hypothetical protein AB1371_08700 [Pseudomonadota bacterium]